MGSSIILCQQVVDGEHPQLTSHRSKQLIKPTIHS
jgi:hypothetical protein